MVLFISSKMWLLPETANHLANQKQRAISVWCLVGSSQCGHSALFLFNGGQVLSNPSPTRSKVWILGLGWSPGGLGWLDGGSVIGVIRFKLLWFQHRKPWIVEIPDLTALQRNGPSSPIGLLGSKPSGRQDFLPVKPFGKRLTCRSGNSLLVVRSSWMQTDTTAH